MCNLVNHFRCLLEVYLVSVWANGSILKEAFAFILKTDQNINEKCSNKISEVQEYPLAHFK